MIINIRKIRSNSKGIVTAPDDLIKLFKARFNYSDAMTHQYFTMRTFVCDDTPQSFNINNSVKQYLGNLFKPSNLVKWGKEISKNSFLTKTGLDTIAGVSYMYGTMKSEKANLAEFLSGLNGMGSIIDYRLAEESIMQGDVIYDAFATGVSIYDNSDVNKSLNISIDSNYSLYTDANIAARKYLEDVIFIRSLVDPYENTLFESKVKKLPYFEEEAREMKANAIVAKDTWLDSNDEDGIKLNEILTELNDLFPNIYDLFTADVRSNGSIAAMPLPQLNINYNQSTHNYNNDVTNVIDFIENKNPNPTNTTPSESINDTGEAGDVVNNATDAIFVGNGERTIESAFDEYVRINNVCGKLIEYINSLKIPSNYFYTSDNTIMDKRLLDNFKITWIECYDPSRNRNYMKIITLHPKIIINQHSETHGHSKNLNIIRDINDKLNAVDKLRDNDGNPITYGELPILKNEPQEQIADGLYVSQNEVKYDLQPIKNYFVATYYTKTKLDDDYHWWVYAEVAYEDEATGLTMMKRINGESVDKSEIGKYTIMEGWCFKIGDYNPLKSPPKIKQQIRPYICPEFLGVGIENTGGVGIFTDQSTSDSGNSNNISAWSININDDKSYLYSEFDDDKSYLASVIDDQDTIDNQTRLKDSFDICNIPYGALTNEILDDPDIIPVIVYNNILDLKDNKICTDDDRNLEFFAEPHFDWLYNTGVVDNSKLNPVGERNGLNSIGNRIIVFKRYCQKLGQDGKLGPDGEMGKCYPSVIPAPGSVEELGKDGLKILYSYWGLTEGMFDSSDLINDLEKEMKESNDLGLLDTISEYKESFKLRAPSPVDIEYYHVFKPRDIILDQAGNITNVSDIASTPIIYKTFVATSISIKFSNQGFYFNENMENKLSGFNNTYIPYSAKYSISLEPAMDHPFEKVAFETFNISKSLVKNPAVKTSETRTAIESVLNLLTQSNSYNNGVSSGSATIEADGNVSDIMLNNYAIPEKIKSIRKILNDRGCSFVISGSNRPLNAEVSASRSSTSLHYTGRAIDLLTTAGMVNPEKDKYVITQSSNVLDDEQMDSKNKIVCRQFNVYARPDLTESELEEIVGKEDDWVENGTDGGEKSVDGYLKWFDLKRVVTNDNIQGDWGNISGYFIDVTELFRDHYFKPIQARKTWAQQEKSTSSDLGAEWWHFQCDEGAEGKTFGDLVYAFKGDKTFSEDTNGVFGRNKDKIFRPHQDSNIGGYFINPPR